MQTKSKNKMVTSSSNKSIDTTPARDAFIVKQTKKGFTPTEILTLMEREGFAPVARSRIYQILKREGVKPVTL